MGTMAASASPAFRRASASGTPGGGDPFGVGCAGDAQQGGFGEGAGWAKVGVSHATIVASAVERAPNLAIG